MMALMVLMGDDEVEAYESRLPDMMEPCEADDERRRDERMLEKEREWKREVLMVATVWGVVRLEAGGEDRSSLQGRMKLAR